MSSTAIPKSDYSPSGIMSTTPTSPTMSPGPTEKSSSNYYYSNFIIIIIMLTDIGGIIGGAVAAVVAVVVVIIVSVVVVIYMYILKEKNRPVTPDKEIEVCKSVVM